VEQRHPVVAIALNRQQAGDALGVSVRQVDRLLAANEIRSVKVGSRRLIPVSEIEVWMQRELEDQN
jgi:excisionase family DNA binding protein